MNYTSSFALLYLLTSVKLFYFKIENLNVKNFLFCTTCQ